MLCAKKYYSPLDSLDSRNGWRCAVLQSMKTVEVFIKLYNKSVYLVGELGITAGVIYMFFIVER